MKIIILICSFFNTLANFMCINFPFYKGTPMQNAWAADAGV